MSEECSIADSKQTDFGFGVDAQADDPLRPDTPWSIMSLCKNLSVVGSPMLAPGNWGLLEWWHEPWTSVRLSSWDRLLLKCYWKARIPIPKAGKWTHLKIRREKLCSSWVVAGPLVFLSSADRYVGEPLEFPQSFQAPIWGSRGKVGFLSRQRRGKGPHHT